MATGYSTLLKIALPVQGELGGSWGDVVNDNITSMIEEAIAGRVVINSWTANAHTLTTANGVTSESRCAMLQLTDSGTQLSGAGQVICPGTTKLYVVSNSAGQAITVKTSGGSGVAVPNGRVMFLMCDGTNVVESITSMSTLQLGNTVAVQAVLDEDNMASNSATALSTQQAIKQYVDSQSGTPSGSITTDKIADSAVTTAKIADNSVTKDKISNPTPVVLSTNSTLVEGTPVYVSTATTTQTLPASPTAGDEVPVMVGDFTDTVIARNGSNIMSLGENMTLDKANIGLTFRYVDATRGWIFA